MKLGMFMMPVNDHRRDTHTVLKEDVEIAVACDRFGFDEFWIGEHYTTLSEPVTCPFMFLSNLIARTTRMKLGTGVVNLPQRHPVQTAAHAALLDHLSDGRLILGVSPGGLVSDFEMFGVTDLQVRREMAGEAIETVLKLWSTDPPYDIRGKYWTLRLEDYHWPDLGVGAMIKPYQKPHPPLVASAMSPNSGGVSSAAARGWGVISANFVPVSTIRNHWQGFSEGCARSGREPRPADWRVARSIFVADDDAWAKAYVRDPRRAARPLLRLSGDPRQAGRLPRDHEERAGDGGRRRDPGIRLRRLLHRRRSGLGGRPDSRAARGGRALRHRPHDGDRLPERDPQGSPVELHAAHGR